MSPVYSVIDESKWDRAVHCNIFRQYSNPLYCITVEMDVTSFLKKIREIKSSFTLGLIYTVTRCANEIEAFRYRFVDGKVVLFEYGNTAFTCLNEGSELFKVINVEMQSSLEAYVHKAKRVADEQRHYFTGAAGKDTYQFSPIPWLSYTQISHTFSGDKENASPLFNWGKYFEREGKILLPFSVQVHHSFVDGYHIAKFIDRLQNALNET